MASTFSASQFTAGPISSVEEKAKFANHFVRFVTERFPSRLWVAWFYRRLSGCFQHIAHYDQGGFWAAWFASPRQQLRWVEHVLRSPCYGSPEYTYSDVEKELQAWLKASDIQTRLQTIVQQDVETSERELLSQLKRRYEPETVGIRQPSL